MTTPSFTRLLDWVDGRLDETAATKVAAHVASCPGAAETVAWIRSFRSAGMAMPLKTPPEDLRAELRNAFRRHTSHPPGTGRVSEFRGDSRPLRMASGARSAESEGIGHITLEGDGVTLTLIVLRRRISVVDLHGHLVWDGSSPRPEIVISGPNPAARRLARPEASGEFRLADVDRSSDEVWVVGHVSSLHGRLELSAPTEI